MTPTTIIDSCTCPVQFLRSRIAETCREIDVATPPTEISTGISCSTSGQVHKKVESDERGAGWNCRTRNDAAVLYLLSYLIKKFCSKVADKRWKKQLEMTVGRAYI